MSNFEHLLEFLAAHRDPTEPLGESPWPQYEPAMGELVALDYGWLFPTNGDSLWPGGASADALGTIMSDDWGDDEVEVDDELVRHPGTPGLAAWDICAWYQPIHVYGRDWGIFIRQDCLIRQARRIYRRTLAGGPPSPRLALEALRASLAIFFLHEHFHHKAESLAIRLQVVQPVPGRYETYSSDVYSKALGTDDCLEEALANADSWRRLVEPRHKAAMSPTVVEAARRHLEQSFRTDPPGYRKAPDFLDTADFRRGLHLLSSQIDEGSTAPSRVLVGRQRDWQWAPGMARSLFSWASRIHLIVPPGARPAVPTRPGRRVP